MTAGIRERPILFSAPMVRAVLRGTKTQTRRVVKGPIPQDATSAGTYIAAGREYDGAWEWLSGDPKDSDTWGVPGDQFRCPYGKPGDRLWVREAFAPAFTWSGYSPDGKFICYRAGPPHRLPDDMRPDATCVPNGKWKPSIHMPRWASRITLEVTRVRVERLQSITHDDISAEGVDFMAPLDDGEDCYVDRFKAGWDALNAKRGFGWDANPWVWAVEFGFLRSSS